MNPEHDERDNSDQQRVNTERRRRAIVQCKGYRCTGIKISEGKWVDLNGKPLEVLEVVTWLEET